MSDYLVAAYPKQGDAYFGAEAWFMRGKAYAEEGYHDLALEAFTQAIVLNPNNADCYFHRAEWYFWRANKGLCVFEQIMTAYEQAIADYTQVITLAPDNAAAYVQRGRAYVQTFECEPAIADYTRAIGLEPDNIDAWYYRGKAYWAQHENDKALTDYAVAIRLNPCHAPAYEGCGDVYAGQGILDNEDNYDRAIEYYTQAINLVFDYHLGLMPIRDISMPLILYPEVASFYTSRGLVYSVMRESDKAIEDYNQVILIAPDAEAYYHRGTEYYYKGDYDTAIEDFTTAIKLDPDHNLAYSFRGRVYYQQGYEEAAIQDCARALIIYPYDSVAKETLELVWAKRGAEYGEEAI
ncbi:hypothetical protein FACS189485_07740 [Spirochaetia bacterium]|nr:hypothetical protein FACS189485_07740 [Spirochaetia bacterium]